MKKSKLFKEAIKETFDDSKCLYTFQRIVKGAKIIVKANSQREAEIKFNLLLKK